jgi:hypothetical protein
MATHPDSEPKTTSYGSYTASGFLSSYPEPDKFQDHLLEQYKLYVEMQDRLSARRVKLNSFNVTLLSTLLAFVALVSDQNLRQFQETAFQAVITLAVGLLGIAICFVWDLNIQSIGLVNASKFKVINAIEQCLPYSCWKKEWEMVKQDIRYRRGFVTTSVSDRILPIALGFPYLGLVIYSCGRLVSLWI